MVAKINRGVSLYGAIVYNQQKVEDATARIIYGNRMITMSWEILNRSCGRRCGRSKITCLPIKIPRSQYCISH